MGSKGHFERIGSNLVTLVYLLQSVDTPFPQQLDIPQEPIVHRLLLQPVDCSCQKERCEKQARGIARGKGKRRGTQMWTGEGSPFSPSPCRIFFSYALFSGSACPDYSGTSPLGHLHSRDTKIWCRKNVHIIFVTVTSIERTPLFRERDTFVGPKAQVLLPFSSVPINAHVCVFCNQKSKRTHASLSARVSDTHKDIFATILEIPTCFIN